MGLSLVYGPAHAGKVALLLDRFVAALDRDPWLIVPNRVDVDRVERELAARRGALLAGTVGTFDTLFAALAGSDVPGRRSRRCRSRPGRPASRRCVHARCVRAVVPVRRVRRLARRRADRGRGQPARSRGSRRRLRVAGTRLRSRARPAGRPRPRQGASPGRRAAHDGSRCLERGAGVRVRLRGSHGCRVAPPRGARRSRRGARLAARTSRAAPCSHRCNGRPTT